MSGARSEEDGQEELSDPSPSSRVDLEAALLASEPGRKAAPGELESPPRRRAWIVMVLSPDPDTRYYVGECLGGRPEMRMVEAGSVAVAELLATHLRPDLLIVDGRITAPLARLPAIQLVDERPDQPAEGSGLPRAWLARPFNAESLVALVDRMLLGTGPTAGSP